MTTIILLLIISIFLSAFFSGAEVALVSIPALKVKHLYEEGVKGSRALLTLKEQPNHMLITILIGNNLVNIGGSALATKAAIDISAAAGVGASAGVGIATGVMTFLILTFGEIAPKTFATRNAKRVSLTIAPIILFLSRLLMPFVWFFLLISTGLERLSSTVNDEPLVTEQEVRHIVNVGEEEGQIKPDEKEMIQKIFLFDDTEVHDVMTPRTDVFMLDWNMLLTDALPVVVEQDYSRIPVYDKSVDKVKGVILARELLEKVTTGDTSLTLKDLAQPPLFVPEQKKIDKLLKELQRKKTHLAVVVNEHGGVEGIITIEDILEEIVGEIFDESDEVEKLIKHEGSNKWLLLGKTPIEIFNEEFKVELPLDEEFNTIAGLIQDRLHRVPEVGERCRLKKEKLDLFVKKMEGPIILEVIAKKV